MLVFSVAAYGETQTLSSSIIIDKPRVIHDSHDDGKTWFVPRLAKSITGGIIGVVQDIHAADSVDSVKYFMADTDGNPLTTLKDIPGFEYNGQWGISDPTPQYNAKYKLNIITGVTTRYVNDKYNGVQEGRQPIYIIINDHGDFSTRKLLYCGYPAITCHSSPSDVVELSNGDMLMPIAAGDGKTFSAHIVRIRYDDDSTLTVVDKSNRLLWPVKRGFLEPQLVSYAGVWLMSLRAEDGNMYVSVTKDWKKWNIPQPWMLNGKAIRTTSTQQHFMKMGKNLFLIYVKYAANTDIPARRAPLFIAKISFKNNLPVLENERILVDREGDGENALMYGNFGVFRVSDKKSGSHKH